jgi:hypothetical protein
MDIEKSLKQLKQTADGTLMKDFTFTASMEQQVRERINARKNHVRYRWYAGTVAAAAVLLLFFEVFSQWRPIDPHGQAEKEKRLLLPHLLWEPPSLWHPAPLQTEVYDNQRFSYYGEKPVRVIAGGFYEDQADKVIWLLNGKFAENVELVAVHEQGQRVDVGSWQVGGPLYDADGHFPSAIALPAPGIWKLQVLSAGKYFGHVFVEVKPGVSPANRQLVEPLIRSYLQGNKQFPQAGENGQTSVEIMGVASPDAERKTVYAWVKILPKDLSSSAGFNSPVKFEIAYVKDRYKVISHQMPVQGDNGQYGNRIRQIFPPKYAKLIETRASEGMKSK